MRPSSPKQALAPTPEPRWPAVAAVLAVGVLNLALPEPLSPGPRWLLLLVLAVLLVPTILARRYRYQQVNNVFGHFLSSLITLFLIWSVAMLIRSLPLHREPPAVLLRSAALLWLTNILVFASWYWRLDAGGPHARDQVPGHRQGAFLFPQMTRPPEENPGWSPHFMDYLFLAFNTSTAFSPTDTAILTRWAKALVMIQSCISLTVIAILAARAVNIL